MPRRVFDPKVRAEIKALRSGNAKSGTRMGALQAARTAAGGRLPDSLFKRAKKGETSIPAKKRK
jgi:hypothetical protein